MGGVRAALVDAVIAAIPVALVYFSGWAYLTSYLGEFGIDATQIDISFTTVLVYAFVPLQAFYVLALFFLLAVLTLAAFLFELYAKDQNDKRNKTIAAIIAFVSALLFVCLLFVIKGAAVDAAEDMAHNVWKGSKSQSIPTLGSSGNDEKVVADLYRACRDGRRLRQIIGLPDQMFLMCRSEVDPCNHGTLFVVNKDGRITYTADKVRRDIDAEKICTS
ncbi:MAG: hypothetical protein E5V60_15635 [Mesorhizobium sp.]|uniref:hypothetical protein n=1 Tax=Mesorhizobium sp. M4A.F.Ca.ET.090.04.2.1 TaxID=2496663 RepID=UPI000FCCB66B|nr:hypothetical protein [Mesorhizobium sp. M4A.F.Ca.ET.090.04.2.1]RVC41667.1 hypothetical protein EN781_25215 [Mesorhizobium sp. M4A.F.Ca.ET.090.04.2.1]RWD10643.1 MAG: hypothetical protein EOS74_29230 [Mesorhizobium sp.]RWD59134.1 MAG: hypothetical protein EOS75_05365 [Mesorhizobium sp.]TIW65566.1 MAG: hypothetical protein E5V60_15635 [Mesorhizobium sp.]